ncbi:TetR/AcrR family transcriptional regulator [Rhizobiaceae bacterium n13]|uniref:TetR/AcrR family transcriptional regulator n=1 Tax=Ferirhizobium litorale TaxID=2927786 RepID=A0AAE3QE34_9HYPH|nr:TetR/AcrR family transcriptional regulator [Fererhizobium litorale]MDI7864687.1 TetR/AcrR family transcriptional regulator [Fererhizobium litorale]MDI7922178.1 TetR/AcrR family transcriptional regulator [Fererhizobium litorale]
MAEKKRSRTQGERSAETLARIRKATIDVMYEKGLSRTSTVEIAAVAGLSRGAMTHHFSSKEEILTDAIASMLEEVNQKLFAFAEDYAERGGTTDEIVDYIWQFMSDRLFYVTMEYLPETRHNADFKDRLIPVVRRFHAGLDAIWSALARKRGVPEDHARIVMNATMCIVRGMIAQTILRDDQEYYAQMLAFWKDEVRRLFPAAEKASPNPSGVEAIS